MTQEKSPTRDEFNRFVMDVRRVIGELISERNTLSGQVIPIGGCIDAKLTAAQIALYFDGTGLGMPTLRWAGWAIRNGNNGTDNADGKFARWSTSASGATGGNDSSAHTHTVDVNHDHPNAAAAAASTTPGNTGNSGVTCPAHTHTGANLDGTPYVLAGAAGAGKWASAIYAVTNGAANLSINSAGSGTGTHAHTSAAHTHDVNLPALGATSKTTDSQSATDNKPAYLTVVPLQRIT